MRLLRTSVAALGSLLSTRWPQTARGAGLLIGLTELALLVLPPHRTPDSGLLGFAGGLILVPNGVEIHKRIRDGDQDS